MFQRYLAGGAHSIKQNLNIPKRAHAGAVVSRSGRFPGCCWLLQERNIWALSCVCVCACVLVCACVCVLNRTPAAEEHLIDPEADY